MPHAPSSLSLLPKNSNAGPLRSGVAIGPDPISTGNLTSGESLGSGYLFLAARHLLLCQDGQRSLFLEPWLDKFSLLHFDSFKYGGFHGNRTRVGTCPNSNSHTVRKY